jgi:hypothetical protein
MDISIVILAHKDSEFLDQCIVSAINQKFNGSFEVILSSDGDPLLKKYSDKYGIKFFLTEKNQSTSCSKNVNNGVTNSLGRYIKLLPYDDWLPENSIQLLFDKINQNNCSLVYANAFDFQNNKNIENKSKPINSISDLLLKNVIHGGTTLFEKKSFLEVGGFDENLIYAEEYDFHLKLINRGKKITYLDEFVFFYRRHMGQKGTNSLTPLERENKKKLVAEIVKRYKQDLVVAGLATVDYRKNVLKQTVDSIIDQVDKLYVYQNGYKEIMGFLNHPKIQVISSLDTGVDMGDAGKFYMLDKIGDCYFLTIDDDIIYPKDYTQNIITSLKKYNNNVIVSHHGRKLKKNATSYYNDIEVGFRCLDDVEKEITIDFGGTGVMGLHTNTVKTLNFDYFKYPNMADIWVGKFAKENKIPIIILPHKKNWIRTSLQLNDKNTIHKKYQFNHDIQNKIIGEINKIKKLKLIFLTCTWGRPNITKIFIDSLMKTQKTLESIFDFENIVVDSENSNFSVFENTPTNFEYLSYPNNPISNKWNFGANSLRLRDFDYVLFLGSDDIMDMKILLEYQKKMKENFDYIGILDMYVYDQKQSDLYYWSGYEKNTGRQGETIGLGRSISNETLKKLNYHPWDNDLNKGLDKTFNFKLKKLTNLKSFKFKLIDVDGFACDIKSDVNITKLKDYKTLLKVSSEKITKFDLMVEEKNNNEVKNHNVLVKKQEEVKIEQKIELTKKQLNYEKINSIFQVRSNTIISKPNNQQNTNNLKLNSQTISKIQNNKKRFR